MILRELTNDEFNIFASNFDDKSPYQSSPYALVMNHHGYTSMLLGLVDNDQIVAASLILIEQRFKFKYAYAPRGFLIDYNNYELLDIFTKKIKIFLNKYDIIAVKINPLIVKNIYTTKETVINPNYDDVFNNLKKANFYHLGYNNYFEALKPRFEAIVDISKPYYQIFKLFRKELKTKIRSADRCGIKIFKGKEDDLDILYKQTQKKYKRDLNYFQDCYKYFNKDNNIEFYYAKLDTKYYLSFIQNKYTKQEQQCLLINQMIIAKSNNYKTNQLLNQKIHNDKLLEIVKKELIRATKLLSDFPEGIIIASALIVKRFNHLYLLIDGFDPKYKNMNAKHLLLWKIMEKYSNLGYKSFNLGGVINPSEKKHKYYGVNNFKNLFSPSIYEYIGDLELVTNNALYFMYRNSAPIRNIINK
ncbi:MAG: peptidoglycan bridge formation glycyltransferase FemA/FemB family protein [Bacilli bacterium]|nr:peptidoglycan bridge formation glycyltransferase FemA/FemB family protein [Bacilli bacterium]